jgi:hypothetical protein
MREQDFPSFTQALDDVSALLSKGGTQSPTAKAMYFRSLAAHPIEAVRAGFDAHIKDPQRGRFMPTPADVIAQIEGLVADDGRPGAEEAWAMACRADDESETVVWSDEMSQAFAVCQPLFAQGDHIGARMAFKESYNRQVEDARKIRRPVAWTTSLGHDPEKRFAALDKAERMGLLGAGEALRIAPPQAGGDALALLLESSQKREGPPIEDADIIRERVTALKEKLMRDKRAIAERAALEAQDLAQRKRDALALAESEAAALGISADELQAQGRQVMDAMRKEARA